MNYSKKSSKRKQAKKIQNEEEYTVEKVIDKKYFASERRYKYFVKWEGFSSKLNTWEPINHIRPVMDLVKAFEMSSKKPEKKIKKVVEKSSIIKDFEMSLKKPEKQINRVVENSLKKLEISTTKSECGSEKKQKNKKIIKICLATNNKEKIKALVEVFENYCEKKCEVDEVGAEIRVGVQVEFKIHSIKNHDSGIFHGQPWGMQHTYEGAQNRLQFMKQKLIEQNQQNDYDFLVSIENGVFSILTHSQTHGQDIACVIIESVKNSKTEFAFSMSRTYPLSEVQQLNNQGVDGWGIGKMIQEYYKDKNLIYSRKDQIVAAATMALSALKVDLLQ